MSSSLSSSLSSSTSSSSGGDSARTIIARREETPSWESCKENAAPLSRGRRVAALDRSFGATGSSGHHHLRRQIEQYERLVKPSESKAATAAEGSSSSGATVCSSDVADDDDDDPLVDWLSYIRFYQESFPADTQQQFLLMERCTRALVKNARYANDDRFIRVCCHYADKTSNAGEIFRYLHQQKVGTRTALFWIAWAWWSEKQEDYPFAEKIYKKAQSKQAQPADLLRQRHKQFQRRMSRHWLNNSNNNTANNSANANGHGHQRDGDPHQSYHHHDNNNDENYRGRSTGSRGVLGALTEERFRRNDRTQQQHYCNTAGNRRHHHHQSSHLSTFVDRNTQRGMQRPANNGVAPATGFPIFVEGEEENYHRDDLDDRCYHHQHKRQLPRDKDKKKENQLVPEPWNQRGGHHSVATMGHRSSSFPPTQPAPAATAPAPTPPFAVYVDEECEAQHQREEEEQRLSAERRRRDRDERTFREREDIGMVEKLVKDPLRYVRNPSKLHSDQAVEEDQQPNHHSRTSEKSVQPKTTSCSNGGTSCGFDKRLLAKDPLGQETCFEEARGKFRFYTLTSSSKNFNNIVIPTGSFGNSSMPAANDNDDDSGMDIDDNGVEGEISMEDTSYPRLPAMQGESSNRMLSNDRTPQPLQGKSLFQTDASFDNKNNVSTCSSTLNEANAVGVLNAKEDETINTKLAMKELSMMFSSPANLDESYRIQGSELRGLNETAAFSIMEDLAQSNMDNNNSILDVGNTALVENENTNAENDGPKNPNARTNKTPGFEAMALRSLEGDAGPVGPVCGARGRRVLGRVAQDDPFRRLDVTPFNDDPGFQIYEEDGEGEDQSASPAGPSPQKETLAVDGRERGAKISDKFTKNAPSTSLGFTIFEDDNEDNDQNQNAPRQKQVGFAIYEDNQQLDQPSTACDPTLRASHPKTKRTARTETTQPKFTIFEDHEETRRMTTTESSRRSDKPFAHRREAATGNSTPSGGFAIFNDTEEPEHSRDTGKMANQSGFAIYDDNQESKEPRKPSYSEKPIKNPRKTAKANSTPSGGFAIFNDTEEDSRETGKSANQSGFAIYDDSKETDQIKPGKVINNSRGSTATSQPGFAIYDDNAKDDIDPKSICSSGNLGTKSGKNNKASTPSNFAIYEDKQDLDKKSLLPPLSGFGQSSEEIVTKKISDLNLHENNEEKKLGSNRTGHAFEIHEDSNSHVLINEKDNARKKSKKVAFDVYRDPQNEDKSPQDETIGGDTADLDDVMQALGDFDTIGSDSDSDSVPPKAVNMVDYTTKDAPCFGDISHIAPDDADDITCEQKHPSKKEICNRNNETVVDYDKIHKSDVQSALKRVQTAGRADVSNKFSLDALLTTKGRVHCITDLTLPRILKSQSLKQGSKIKIDERVVIVKEVLGRGSYGVVVLLEDNDDADFGNIAVKAQTPTDCLAWEFEIMQKVEKRTGKHLDKEEFPFARALSFVSLSDGALLSMTAASSSGLNLVDLVNVYKSRFSENVPEIVALHYTSRMLKHTEMLHLHGKVLHCDAKPDNWALMGSAHSYQNCAEFVDASDLMLVDFGRAVDLTSCASTVGDSSCTNVTLNGDATVGDMRCVAMRNECPWSFDVDTFGICASAHIILFGDHLQIELDRKKRRWQPRQRFRRYWQKELWLDLFDTLLNTEEEDDDDKETGTTRSSNNSSSSPRSLQRIRRRIDEYLVTQTDKLEAALKRQARELPSSRNRLK